MNSNELSSNISFRYTSQNDGPEVTSRFMLASYLQW